MITKTQNLLIFPKMPIKAVPLSLRQEQTTKRQTKKKKKNQEKPEKKRKKRNQSLNIITKEMKRKNIAQ